jgi:tRNA(fMet)-specific endonuclease VapC
MRALVDTNAYTALLAGDARIAAELSEREAVLLNPIVIGELLEGFLNGSRNQQNREVLRAFRDKPRTVTVPMTEDTAEWFAQIKQSLRKRGTPIPINDVWIAATCMEHGAALITLDEHFSHIDGLVRRPLP